MLHRKGWTRFLWVLNRQSLIPAGTSTGQCPRWICLPLRCAATDGGCTHRRPMEPHSALNTKTAPESVVMGACVPNPPECVDDEGCDAVSMCMDGTCVLQAGRCRGHADCAEDTLCRRHAACHQTAQMTQIAPRDSVAKRNSAKTFHLNVQRPMSVWRVVHVPGRCQAPTCDDQLRNADETDVDCGGESCALRGRSTLLGGHTLPLRVCHGGVCQVPTCIDGIRNGAEVDTDCGGLCPPCESGHLCVDSADCLSRVCRDEVCRHLAVTMNAEWKRKRYRLWQAL